jgi:death on curing protein
MSQAWVWVELETVLWLHSLAISRFPGTPGIRDLGGIHSAIARPRHLAAYGEPSAAALAAAYTNGIQRNQGFVDGNKRTAFLTGATFLERNGFWFDAPTWSIVQTMENLGAGLIDEFALTSWFNAHMAALKD